MKPPHRGSVRAIADRQLNLAAGIWVTDDVLASTFQRFVHGRKRFASNVPGPLEARRRLARRRMAGLAHPRPSSSGVWEPVLSWVLQLWKQDQPMRYEPPRPTPALPTVGDMHMNASTTLQPLEQSTAEDPVYSDTEVILDLFIHQFHTLAQEDCLDLFKVTRLLRQIVPDSSFQAEGVGSASHLNEQEWTLRMNAFQVVFDSLTSTDQRLMNLKDFLAWVSPMNPCLTRAQRTNLLLRVISEFDFRASQKQDAGDILEDVRHLYFRDFCDIDGNSLLRLFSHLSRFGRDGDGIADLRDFLNTSSRTGQVSPNTVTHKFVEGLETHCAGFGQADTAPLHSQAASQTVQRLPAFLGIFDPHEPSQFVREVTRLARDLDEDTRHGKPSHTLHFWLECLQGAPVANGKNRYDRMWTAVWDVLAARRDPVQMYQVLAHLDRQSLSSIILRHWGLQRAGTRQRRRATAFFKYWIDSSYRRIDRHDIDMPLGLLHALHRAQIPMERTFLQLFGFMLKKEQGLHVSLLKFLDLVPGKFAISDAGVLEVVSLVAQADPLAALHLMKTYKFSSPNAIPELLVQLASMNAQTGLVVRDLLKASHNPLWRPFELGTGTKALLPQYVEAIEMTALAFARNQHHSNSEAYQNVHYLYHHLEKHGAPMSSTMAQALMHAGLTRYIKSGEYLSQRRFQDTMDRIQAIEGEKVASGLAEKVEGIRRMLGWHARFPDGRHAHRRWKLLTQSRR